MRKATVACLIVALVGCGEGAPVADAEACNVADRLLQRMVQAPYNPQELAAIASDIDGFSDDIRRDSIRHAANTTNAVLNTMAQESPDNQTFVASMQVVRSFTDACTEAGL